MAAEEADPKPTQKMKAMADVETAAPRQVEGDTAEQVLSRIDARTATIGVVGLGYVGLPLAVEYARSGFNTVGIDMNESRVDRLKGGESYVDDVEDEDVQELVAEERLQLETSFARASEVDVFFVCVPTPVTDAKDPDTSYVESAAESIGQHLRPGQLVILKSTTYPSTTENVVLPILKEVANGTEPEVGEDYFVAYSPERIDPGNAVYQTGDIPVVVGGITEACSTVAERTIEVISDEVHVVSNPKVAEMEKLLENIFRSVNIALVNELARLCDRIGDVSMWEVVDAAATKPFGFMPFYPGPGLGGHCIPIDPHYLSWLAEKYDFETSFITLAASVNESMPYYAVEAVVEAIAQQPVRLADANVLVLGVAYKANVNDTRHSPAERVIRLLKQKGVDGVQYHDPHVPAFEVRGQENERIEIPRTDLTPHVLENSDVAVLLTGHDAFDTEMVARHASFIVDTRNALDDVSDPDLRDKITLLGGGQRTNGRTRPLG